MAVTDGSPESNKWPPGVLDIKTNDPKSPHYVPESLPPAPKKRNSKSYKTIAKQLEDDAMWWHDAAMESQAQTTEVLANMEAWKTTNTLNYRLFKAAAGVAIAELVVILWLAFR